MTTAKKLNLPLYFEGKWEPCFCYEKGNLVFYYSTIYKQFNYYIALVNNKCVVPDSNPQVWFRIFTNDPPNQFTAGNYAIRTYTVGLSGQTLQLQDPIIFQLGTSLLTKTGPFSFQNNTNRTIRVRVNLNVSGGLLSSTTTLPQLHIQGSANGDPTQQRRDVITPYVYTTAPNSNLGSNIQFDATFELKPLQILSVQLTNTSGPFQLGSLENTHFAEIEEWVQ